MDTFRADLHCHSNYSDGSCSPSELVALAHHIKLQGLSITDHDTIAAYNPALLETSHQYAVEIISGVEFSSHLNDFPVHILGYAFDLQNTALLDFCRRHTERRERRNLEMLVRLKKLGIILSYEDLKELNIPESQIIGRPHIAQALVKKGVVSSIQEAFSKYLGEGKLAYYKGENVSIEETLQVIHDASGLSIIAHPHLIKNPHLIKKLLEFPFDGIEGYYAKLPPEQHQHWIHIASQRGWLVTGGSDFHGKIKPQIPLGCSWVPQETFQFLRKKHIEANPNFI